MKHTFYKRSWLSRIFGTRYIGLDISDHYIRYAEVKKRDTFVYPVSYGKYKIPNGVISSGKILNSESLRKILTSIRTRIKTRYVRVSIPSGHVTLFTAHIKRVHQKNLNKTIQAQLRSSIPNADKFLFDFSILTTDNDGYDVQVYLMPKIVIQGYLDVLRQSGFTPLTFEANTEALSRAVISPQDDGTHMLVDIGDHESTLSIVKNRIPLYSSTFDFGGTALVNTIKEKLSVDSERAEYIKNKQGVGKNDMYEDMPGILLGHISLLRDEINEHVLSWSLEKNDSEKTRTAINKIMLSGPHAGIPGLAEYLTVSLRRDVEPAKIWDHLLSFDERIPQMNRKDALAYATAIGLALGGLE
ncbi:hypothetical protein COB64_00690 [Candidatus Wolfebacteria bacterium]|nr:MAG: hypothetical protein COB64_00690 [Candidatus Wolfebacteria bacterium]